MKKVTIAICIAPELKIWIQEAATKNGLSISSFVSMVITKAMRDDQGKAE